MEGTDHLTRIATLALIAASAALAQVPQNPSPMVEHTRRHPRLNQEHPPGSRELLELGSLFLPEKLKGSEAPLLVFFHGCTWLPEVAAARRRMAAIAIQVGSGSGAYAKAFADRSRFPNLIAEAERKSGVRFVPIVLGGWSAGCGSIRELLRQPSYDRIGAVLAIDGIHAGYASGKPGPLESSVRKEDLDAWLKLARDAIAGRKRFVMTHSEIFPGTYASTTETADYLIRETGVARRPILRWGPMGTQQISQVRAGRWLVMGFAGNSAPDHVDKLHSLVDYLEVLLRP